MAAVKNLLKAANGKISELTVKLATALKAEKHMVDEMASMKSSFANIKSQLILARKLLEQETVLREERERERLGDLFTERGPQIVKRA